MVKIDIGIWQRRNYFVIKTFIHVSMSHMLFCINFDKNLYRIFSNRTCGLYEDFGVVVRVIFEGGSVDIARAKFKVLFSSRNTNTLKVLEALTIRRFPLIYVFRSCFIVTFTSVIYNQYFVFLAFFSFHFVLAWLSFVFCLSCNCAKNSGDSLTPLLHSHCMHVPSSPAQKWKLKWALICLRFFSFMKFLQMPLLWSNKGRGCSSKLHHR